MRAGAGERVGLAIVVSWGGIAATGCGSAPVPATVVTLARGEGDGGSAVRQFEVAEEKALGHIAATNPRFARRTGLPADDELVRSAIVKALAAGDSDVALNDGALDTFSFTARARGLEEAGAIVASSPALAEVVAVNPSGPIEQGGKTELARPPLERELLGRLIAEETARLAEERALPRGASALMRGLVETWTPPATPEARMARDKWLAGRLDLVRASLPKEHLSRGALFELDDALDPLERLVPSADLPFAAGAIARLRVALGETAQTGDAGDAAPSAAPNGSARWARLQEGIQAHLGLRFDADGLRARLEGAERALRAMAKQASLHAEERATSRAAESLTFAAGECGPSDPGSRVRRMAPPPERAFVCGALHAFRDATDDLSRAAAAVALHDEVVVALWALAIHGPHGTGRMPDASAALPHPFFGIQPDREARLVRIADARPVAAIGAGLAAGMLMAEGLAPRWQAFGDAPLDIIERELPLPPPR